ncbi:PH domain-containing protein [Actinoalloteichus spitiensis]|uniref:PH domain-containing protein n=1 Tax=Actinoalloteichus spitiensis TaxID=252394 RepID=UPI00036E2EE9|nr:PH domain-containing protein [Actinoalloteichus spitiensis]
MTSIDPSPGGEAADLRLRAPEHRVAPRAIIWWSLQALIGWLVVTLPQAGLLLFTDDAPVGATWALWACVAVGVLHVAIMPSWRYRVHRWEVAADAVYTQTGWLTQEWRVAPASRIQTVDAKRGPLQQLFGLSTVTVTTASAAGPLHIEGLEHRLAAALVEELTATTQAVPGDAT